MSAITRLRYITKLMLALNRDMYDLLCPPLHELILGRSSFVACLKWKTLKQEVASELLESFQRTDIVLGSTERASKLILYYLNQSFNFSLCQKRYESLPFLI
jgi:hypothetical protein